MYWYICCCSSNDNDVSLRRDIAHGDSGSVEKLERMDRRSGRGIAYWLFAAPVSGHTFFLFPSYIFLPPVSYFLFPVSLFRPPRGIDRALAVLGIAKNPPCRMVGHVHSIAPLTWNPKMRFFQINYWMQLSCDKTWSWQWLIVDGMGNSLFCQMRW
jgi:hypothetical protein